MSLSPCAYVETRSFQVLLTSRYRAKANGLLGVENPVAQALHEGRLEELSDSDESD